MPAAPLGRLLLLLCALSAAGAQSGAPVFLSGTPSVLSAGSAAVSFTVGLTSPGQVAFALLPAYASTPTVRDVLNSSSTIAGLVARCVFLCLCLYYSAACRQVPSKTALTLCHSCRGVVTVATANVQTTAYILSNLTGNTSYALFLVGQDTAQPPNAQARANSEAKVGVHTPECD